MNTNHQNQKVGKQKNYGKITNIGVPLISYPANGIKTNLKHNYILDVLLHNFSVNIKCIQKEKIQML